MLPTFWQMAHGSLFLAADGFPAVVFIVLRCAVAGRFVTVVAADLSFGLADLTVDARLAFKVAADAV